ncbi:hypothetical protein Sxan_12850 [Streptomyces xanthophaeus]|uniref:Transposase n=1 Tax=Streptomyces xanthophaeus TaxID=67385 RepID=A0A919GWB9_9ACTN|nr:hypothetical protein Sxan_12850 [Streptomyces xanthophaeus]
MAGRGELTEAAWERMGVITSTPPAHVKFRHCLGAAQGHWVLLHPVVLEYESTRSTTKTRVEPAGINGEGDWLP